MRSRESQVQGIGRIPTVVVPLVERADSVHVKADSIICAKSEMINSTGEGDGLGPAGGPVLRRHPGCRGCRAPIKIEGWVIAKEDGRSTQVRVGPVFTPPIGEDGGHRGLPSQLDGGISGALVILETQTMRPRRQGEIPGALTPRAIAPFVDDELIVHP